MADVIYKRGQLVNLNESTVPIKDGQLIVGYDLAEETGKLYMDVGTKRCEIIGSGEGGEGSLPVQENGGMVLNDQETNKAITEFSTAAGTNSIAGWMGYKVIGKLVSEDGKAVQFIVEDGNLPEGEKAYNALALNEIQKQNNSVFKYLEFFNNIELDQEDFLKKC